MSADDQAAIQQGTASRWVRLYVVLAAALVAVAVYFTATDCAAGMLTPGVVLVLTRADWQESQFALTHSGEHVLVLQGLGANEEPPEGLRWELTSPTGKRLQGTGSDHGTNPVHPGEVLTWLEGQARERWRIRAWLPTGTPRAGGPLRLTMSRSYSAYVKSLIHGGLIAIAALLGATVLLSHAIRRAARTSV
jgi:hypothetical protein